MDEKELITISREMLERFENVISEVSVDLMRPIMKNEAKITERTLLDCTAKLSEIGLEMLEILYPEEFEASKESSLS